LNNRDLWPLRDDRVNVQPLLGVPDFRIFGGTAVQRSPVPASFSGPHANVHNAFAPGDMANLQFSPRDPVFYAHHGNIDRLWSSWVATPGGHSNPDFGTARVFFYDENREWRYVLMNDLRDESKLGYKYSSLMQPRVPIASLKASSLGKTANRVTLAVPTLESVKAGGPSSSSSRTSATWRSCPRRRWSSASSTAVRMSARRAPRLRASWAQRAGC